MSQPNDFAWLVEVHKFLFRMWNCIPDELISFDLIYFKIKEVAGISLPNMNLFIWVEFSPMFLLENQCLMKYSKCYSPPHKNHPLCWEQSWVHVLVNCIRQRIYNIEYENMQIIEGATIIIVI